MGVPAALFSRTLLVRVELPSLAAASFSQLVFARPWHSRSVQTGTDRSSTSPDFPSPSPKSPLPGPGQLNLSPVVPAFADPPHCRPILSSPPTKLRPSLSRGSPSNAGLTEFGREAAGASLFWPGKIRPDLSDSSDKNAFLRPQPRGIASGTAHLRFWAVPRVLP